MENKIILITGSTDGIGKITATTLAEQGHTIILHGRNASKATRVRDEIIAATGNNNIDVLIADLLSLADVKKAAEEFKSKYSHLDVLINNAGAFFGKARETTKEGLEKTITLNLLAPILLTKLLLDSMSKSRSARIVNVYSAMHKRGGIPDFDDFQSQNSYKPDRAYALSKLYLVWATRHLAKQLKEKGMTNITVNAYHPGAVATNFGQDSDKGFFMNMIFKVALKLMPKPEIGARTAIYLATSPKMEGITAKFFGNNKNEEKPDDKYYSQENEKKVWNYCMQTIKPYL